MGGNQMVGFFICNEQRRFVEDIYYWLLKEFRIKFDIVSRKS